MKRNKNFPKIRSWIMIALIFAIFSGYFYSIMQVQIVDAEMYREMVRGLTISTQPIKAVRGEILDRNGEAIVANQTSYDVILDRVFLPYGEENAVIFDLINLFEESSAQWIDNLPITNSQPFEYIKDRDQDIATLQSFANVHSYTTAQDLMHWLISDFELEEYSPEDARKIAAVRYEMKRKDFSSSIPYVFAEDIDIKMVITVKERSQTLPGLDVITSSTRVYNDDSFAPHIIGLTGPLYAEDYQRLKDEGKIFAYGDEFNTRSYTLDDTIGKSGIEQALEDELRGFNGLREVQIAANGQVISVEESIKTLPGHSVKLTLDRHMQNLASEALEAQIKHLNETQPAGRGGEAHSGAVVVLNPKTGEVLAAATYPSYTVSEYKSNYSKLANDASAPLVSRALLGQYTPGSIYKPVVAITGLNNGIITEKSTFNCTGRYYFFAPSYTPKCLSTHGPISVNNAIGWSCNIFFYETGRLAGIDEIDKTAKALGLGEPTGIEIPEGAGQRSNPEVKAERGAGEWYGADTIQTAIGQFDNRFTPLQLANYVATIANRGTRMKLTLVNEIVDFNSGEAIVPFEPKVAAKMDSYSSEAFEVTIKGMINATTGSSGGTFGGYPIAVASKTGTPQVTEDMVNSTFIAFAPAEDPELAIAVIIEEGWQGYTCAPVAKAIFDDYFGIEHRGAVASGPQRLKDYRKTQAGLGASFENNRSDIDAVFPQYKNGIPAKG